MTENSFCSLEPDPLARRVEEWETLAGSLVGRHQTATGAALRFELKPGLADKLLELVEAEGDCCPGLSFTAEVRLEIAAPEEMRAWVTETFLGRRIETLGDGDAPEVVEA